MRVEKTDFIEGAKNARGVVVIIDVFRAFSTACYCFKSGAGKIIAVGAVEDAVALREEIDGAVLIGERQGKKLLGFDFGNSPTEINSTDLRAKTIIHTTHAGTQGLVNAVHATELLTGAFVNATATVNYIKGKSPELVTLVRMGLEATIPSDEDNLCAEYLESLLVGGDFDESIIEPTLRKSSFAARFFDPEKPWNPPGDFELCLKVNAFDFVIKADVGEKGRVTLRKISI